MPATVQCEICPKRCLLKPGQGGDCRIRVNLDGQLTALTYGFVSAVHVDPMEKKPLYHYLPGTPILSIATVGCNLHCKNCQNWEISQCNPEDAEAARLPPEDLPRIAKENGCASIAYTYTDPIAYYEYALDGSARAREAGLRNVLVTAGYINEKPWKELCAVTDAANIDLKAMSDRFYRDVCGATLQPVLDALVAAKNAGVWVEITNLVIPTLNDGDRDFKAVSGWVRGHMGKETPLHFSRFHPQYRMQHLPPTPEETLVRARDIALAEGLLYVYDGNILRPESSTTACPSCRKPVIRRVGMRMVENRLSVGKCPDCGAEVHGKWN